MYAKNMKRDGGRRVGWNIHGDPPQKHKAEAEVSEDGLQKESSIRRESSLARSKTVHIQQDPSRHHIAYVVSCLSMYVTIAPETKHEEVGKKAVCRKRRETSS